MHYMEGVGDDQLSFAIWTGSDPDAAIFTMTASSGEKKKEWLLALKKLRESQHAFAMGKEKLEIEQDAWFWSKFLKSFRALFFLKQKKIITVKEVWIPGFN